MDVIAHHLANHHGIITRNEAKKLGMSDRKIGYRVETGAWQRISAGVFRLAGTPETWHGRVRAAGVVGRRFR